ncbi:MAG: hypothetical protein Q9168_002627 [Polycauliona sp. 1 TL-2023]
MPSITSLDGHGTPNRKRTYSDVAKGLLHDHHGIDESSIGMNYPRYKEPLAVLAEQHGHADVPRTPQKIETISLSPHGYPKKTPGAPSRGDPYSAAKYPPSAIHHDLGGHAPTTPLSRGYFQGRVPDTRTSPYNPPSVQQTPNPLQMTIYQQQVLAGSQVWPSYGHDSHGRTVQNGNDHVTSGAQTQNAGNPTLRTQETGRPDLVKKYDVLMNQYTERFYGCDFDQARYLSTGEAPKDSGKKQTED